MAPYNPDVVKDIVADAILAGPRGTQTRLAEAVGVNIQTVNKWSKKQTAPDMHRWPAIERFFHWRPGHIATEAGMTISGTVFELGGLRFEGPPDFIVEADETVTLLITLDRSDPALEELWAQEPLDDQHSGERAADAQRVQELAERGEVVRLTLAGSDAEVYAVKTPAKRPAARRAVIGRRGTGKTAGALKAVEDLPTAAREGSRVTKEAKAEIAKQARSAVKKAGTKPKTGGDR